MACASSILVMFVSLSNVRPEPRNSWVTLSHSLRRLQAELDRQFVSVCAAVSHSLWQSFFPFRQQHHDRLTTFELSSAV